MPTEFKHPLGPGDRAFVLHENRVVHVHIDAVRAFARSSGRGPSSIPANITFFVRPVGSEYDTKSEIPVDAGKVFQTKEALLASL